MTILKKEMGKEETLMTSAPNYNAPLDLFD